MMPPGLSDRQRFLAWRDLYNQHVGRADLVASEAPFDGRMEFIRTNDVLMGRVSVTVQRSEHGGRRAQSSDEGRIGLLINTSAGPIHSRHRAHDEFLAPGGFMLLSRVDQGRFIPSQYRSDWVIIDLPEDAVLRVAPKAEDLVGTPLRAVGESFRMIAAYSDMMFRQDDIADPLVNSHVSQTLIDLVGLALGAEKDAATIANERGMRAARLDAILREIAAGYLDPSFSVRAVATKLRLSPRYIQDLLQNTGTGFSARVLELRLQHSASLLAHMGARARKVSDIAFSCGFNDLSYFHRCFRRRFGVTPSGARAA